jgi:hypothetical protein
MDADTGLEWVIHAGGAALKPLKQLKPLKPLNF